MCGFCLNAFVDGELTHETDLSARSVGTSFDGVRFMLVSGNRLPVRIEVDRFSSDLRRWVTEGVFLPRFCPMCGRELSEFNIDERGCSYSIKSEQGS